MSQVQDQVPQEDLTMFGYVIVNRLEMKVRDLELYRGYYCGLCHELHERYGRRGQLLLSYDAAFLVILLSGLYEPEETKTRRRCLVHPAVRHLEVISPYTRYAADMNVMLAYLKALDDWQDERKQAARLTAMLLHGDYCRIRDRYPRQAGALLRNIRALRRMEKEQPLHLDAGEPYSEKLSKILARIDRAAGYTGGFFAQLCAPHQDHWMPDLKETGFYLGKFIYLIDAYDDLEKDKKSGSFNILLPLLESDPDTFEETVKSLLLDMAACCCRAFERLPIVKDVDILRNVLYSGIWVRYNQVRKSRSKFSKEEDHERSI